MLTSSLLKCAPTETDRIRALAYIVMAYTGIAYIVMAYTVMAHTVMAHIVMAHIGSVLKCGHGEGTASERWRRVAEYL